VDVDGSRSGIVSVICGHSVGWAIDKPRAKTIQNTCSVVYNFRGLAGGHIDGVGEIHRYALPFFVYHYEGKGTRNVMHGANAAAWVSKLLIHFSRL
jgi:hypothetical protein